MCGQVWSGWEAQRDGNVGSHLQGAHFGSLGTYSLDTGCRLRRQKMAGPEVGSRGLGQGTDAAMEGRRRASGGRAGGWAGRWASVGVIEGWDESVLGCQVAGDGGKLA